MRDCIYSAGEPVFLDRKLRVVEAAQSGDSYVFLGGYQMNINVGQSFSISRSDSYSRGWGIEATDMIAPFLKNAGPLGAMLKPFSYKLSGSSSVSSSDGTNVSESTYLVAQIAKFRVRLDKYERCAAVKFHSKFWEHLRMRSASHVLSTLRVNEELVKNYRPLFVCEGQVRETPEFVDEMYFYFTQHFTEGDMLDQADLYNHPWLLALRGYRDFFTFVNTIRSQEVTSFWDAVTGGAFAPKTRDIDWPLAHMRESYLQMSPSFPGFYTILNDEKGEGMTEFPLEERLQTADPDINHEVPDGYKPAQPDREVPGQ
jgi:hypothetical protein